jgi:aminobenzoyl-glutamate utilization protein B
MSSVGRARLCAGDAGRIARPPCRVQDAECPAKVGDRHTLQTIRGASMTGSREPSNSPEKDFAEAFIDRNEQAIKTLYDSIFYFGELGMQEFETAKLMCDLLENDGFSVERGIAGFPTGFCATYGSGEPVIAIHTEYDANPDNSQKAGLTEQATIVEGAPGHCEGHNVNGTVMIAGALAAKQAMEKYGLKGTLKVFGAPAEEQLVSRPY